MWARLLKALGLIQPDFVVAVREWLRNTEPRRLVVDSQCLGQEDDHWIVRIFYQGFLVTTDLMQITELPCGPDSPYFIFGRK